ncbi:MAG TPA: hypothetical protein VIM89_23880 [Mucilaginibacter sp.]
MLAHPTKFAATLIFLFSTALCSAQSVIVPNGTRLPGDTIVKNQLINSLNGFLAQKERPAKENQFVLKEHLSETAALLDEMKGIEHSPKANDFYKPYLLSAVKLDDDHFIIQLSYQGVNDNMPVLQASFKLIAEKQADKFYFSSTLKRNTISWKSKKSKNITCFYKDMLNDEDIKACVEKSEFYDKKLNIPVLPTLIYYCDNFPEVLQIIGIDYYALYNGIKDDLLTTDENGIHLVINGWNSEKHRFDPHDMWHDKLRMVMNNDVINRPVDEGCAYLYGGSWGYDWPEIIAKFKKYATENPNADWLNLYIDSKNFEEGEKPLRIPYMLNALIARKIEKEKGFSPVMELLACGKREKGDDNYFKALEKISGISKANFNASMLELIKSAK